MKRHNLHNSQSLSVLTGRGGGALNAMVILFDMCKVRLKTLRHPWQPQGRECVCVCVQKSGIEVLANGGHQQNLESSPVK